MWKNLQTPWASKKKTSTGGVVKMGRISTWKNMDKNFPHPIFHKSTKTSGKGNYRTEMKKRKNLGFVRVGRTKCRYHIRVLCNKRMQVTRDAPIIRSGY